MGSGDDVTAANGAASALALLTEAEAEAAPRGAAPLRALGGAGVVADDDADADKAAAATVGVSAEVRRSTTGVASSARRLRRSDAVASAEEEEVGSTICMAALSASAALSSRRPADLRRECMAGAQSDAVGGRCGSDTWVTVRSVQRGQKTKQIKIKINTEYQSD